MRKVFISCPMKGKTKDEIDLIMDYVKLKIIQVFMPYETVEFVNTWVEGEFPEDGNRSLFCLGKSLELMAMCDTAVFAKGWEDARGCRIEHEAAMNYGLDVIEMYGEVRELTEIEKDIIADSNGEK